ncbi:hypothetical protein QL898_05575 [Psychrobacter sp. APC 3279]|uniref:hypothetical protein n=1 Tax=Psychrobacter sp. APC 3279 TaxID=3035189 RepID=UPI0025B3A0EC|nr:hypothetical protein [Psychrobacter sp. APC 3279]MDN3441094.1 hypothetical protein [Psychrobacter sp. APC 3279]
MSTDRNKKGFSDELKGFFDPNDTRHNTQQNFDESYQEQPSNEQYQDQIWTEVSNTSKPWYRSKTMLFNIGVTAIGVSQAVLPFAQPFVNPRTYGLLTTAVGVANMALRGITRDGIQRDD